MRLVNVGRLGEPDHLAAGREDGGKSELRTLAAVAFVLRLDHDDAAADVQNEARTFVLIFVAEKEESG